MIKLLGDRLMILPYTETEVLDSGMELSEDTDFVPRATVVAVSNTLQAKEDLIDLPKVGDQVLFTMPREKGVYKHEGVEHNIVPIGNIVAIL